MFLHFRKATNPKPRFDPLGYYDRRIKEALLFAVNRVKGFTRMELMLALDRGDIQGAVELLRWDEGDAFLRSVLPAHLRDAFELAGQEASAALSRKLHVTARFDLTNQRAVEFVRQRGAALITEFGASSREGVRAMIVRAFDDKLTVRQTARLVRESGIGLTSRQAGQVMNLRRRLERDTELNLSDSQLNARVDRYAAAKLRERAEAIARTEIIQASREGTQESWDQAVQSGLLDPSEMAQEWIATPDERECDVCAELDGTTAALGSPFPGGYEGPPAHPMCRCAIGLTVNA